MSQTPDAGPSGRAPGTLEVDPEVIDRVIGVLERKTRSLERSGFDDVDLPESSFGRSAPGAELGFHHSLAHRVVVDTLAGVVNDLGRFRDGIRDARALVQQADDTATADLQQKQARAAALLATAAARSEAEERNLQARAQHLNVLGDGG